MLHQGLTQPEVLSALAMAGHGDMIAIVDSNYPAQSRRDRNVPLINLNISHQVVATPLMIQLVAGTIPIERCTIPVPAEDGNVEGRRPVHETIVQATKASNPHAEVVEISPQDFYDLTSSPALAFMIVTGERSHYGSAVLTVGYLPELN